MSSLPRVPVSGTTICAPINRSARFKVGARDSTAEPILLASEGMDPEPTAHEAVGILLVDDSPGQLLAMEAVLEGLEVDLVRALSGNEALRQIETHRFAVVLLDIHLPDLDGLEVARRVRRLQDFTPIIFVSGIDDQRSCEAEAYSLGAVDFLMKPVSSAVLRAKVKVFVDLFRQSLRLRELERRAFDAERQKTDATLAQLNQDLQRRVQEFETLLAVLPVGIGVAGDRQCRHIKTNPAFAEQLGLSANDNASLTAPASERPRNFKIFQNGLPVRAEELPMQVAAAEGREIRDVEYDVVHSDGRTNRLLEYAAPFFDENGCPRGSVGVFIDITDRRRHEEALRASEERFRMMADSAPVLIWISGPDKRCYWFNKPWLDFTGRTWQQEIGDGWAHGVHPDDRERCVQTYVAAFDARQQFHMDYRLRRHDGVYRWMVDHGVPLYGAGGEFTGYIGSCIDITDRRASEEQNVKLLEEVLRQSHQLEVLSRASQEVNTVLDTDAILRTLIASALELVEAQSGCAGVIRNNSMVFSEYSDRGRIIPIDIVFLPDDQYGIPSWVMRERRAYVTNDAASDNVIRPDLRAEFGIENAINLPIQSRQGELLGCLELHNKRDRAPFTENDQLRLQGLAASAAIALENTRLLTQVREADRRKDDFLAMLAHELRNPLAPVRNSLDILKLQNSKDKTFLELREIMDRQIRHMSRLIDDLLDVSRISRGRVQLRPERIDLARLVRTSASDHGPAAASAGLTVRTNIPDAPIWVHGDNTRLAQVLDNLLSNAIKFTNRGGTIELRLIDLPAQNHAELVVSDTGIGIAADDLATVFDVFSQADRSLDRSRGGLGLGLALVKGLVELHGGRVEARSGGLNQGSTFTIRLPTVSAPAVREIESKPASPAPARVQVLLIEDNRDAAAALKTLLRLMGYDVTVAHSGPEGLDLARRMEPQVVLCDIGLPGMDGYAVAAALRQIPRLSGVALIAITGYGREEDRARTRDAGFDDHVTKPPDADALVQKIQSLLDRPHGPSAQLRT